jgi:hypothetical protein
LAFASAWAAVAGSWLDYVVGIRMRGSSGRNYHIAPTYTTCAAKFKGLAASWRALSGPV